MRWQRNEYDVVKIANLCCPVNLKALFLALRTLAPLTLSCPDSTACRPLYTRSPPLPNPQPLLRYSHHPRTSTSTATPPCSLTPSRLRVSRRPPRPCHSLPCFGFQPLVAPDLHIHCLRATAAADVNTRTRLSLIPSYQRTVQIVSHPPVLIDLPSAILSPSS